MQLSAIKFHKSSEKQTKGEIEDWIYFRHLLQVDDQTEVLEDGEQKLRDMQRSYCPTNHCLCVLTNITFLDRRILCDRTLPACSNCSRSDRKCQGYGLRLSWPKTNDRKRSQAGKAPFQLARIRHFEISDSRLINYTYFDMDIHHHLSVARSNGGGFILKSRSQIY